MLLAAIVAACGGDPVETIRRVPASLTTETPPSASAVVGGSAGTWRVRVRDGDGEPLPGALVRFATSRGGGTVTPMFDTTDADGIASTTLRVGTVAGTNEITATTANLAPLKSALIQAAPGPIRSLAFSTRAIRITASQDSVFITASPRDTFGNVAQGAFTLVTDNPALVSIRAPTATTAWVRAVTRPGEGRVFGSVGGTALPDGIPVAVLAAGSSPCAFLARDTALAVGEMLPFEGSALACLRTATNAEYVLVSNYGTTTSGAVAGTTMSGAGLGIPAPFPASAMAAFAPTAAPPLSDVVADVGFERELRVREREIETRAAGARAWRRATLPTSMQASIAAQPRVGDRLTVNVNSNDFCTNPSFTETRIAAVSDVAVVLEDLSNPADGFTEAEYQAIARGIDTLVYPLDTAMFGPPTDIDGNGRVVVLFSKAVNALTPRVSSGVVLGFFFSRDLLPRQSPSGSCVGSNAGEMFYVLVPDPTGSVSAVRTKQFVQSVALGTIAHELQHLINSSRRLYVNDAQVISEEPWLNEGLSHVAEELVFYRASGRAPRQNLDAAALADPATRAAFDLFQNANFRRFLEYLRLPASFSPVGDNDQLQTRGAAWAFLRYVADRAGATDGDFWRRLVNSKTVGANNLQQQLAGTGLSVASALRDWGVAIVTDDLVATGDALRQPSWHFLSAFPQVGLADWLSPQALINNAVLQPAVRGGSSAYARFAAGAGQDALIQASGPGGVPIPGMRFTIVRIK